MGNNFIDPNDPSNREAQLEVDKLLESDLQQKSQIQHQSYRNIINKLSEELDSGKLTAKQVIKEQQLHLQNYVRDINEKNKSIELLKIHLVNSRRQ